ncbi:MAG TPA: ester cyclase [Thermomicrobiales bacterium]|nr:ester cyclase [Thermomicrobiales bacterium]
MSVEANKALIRRYFETWNANDVDALDDIIAADAIDHMAYEGQQAGRAGYRDFYATWHSAFPGFRAEIEDMIAEGDRVATRWTFRGRHLGEYNGIAPTGREIVYTAVSIQRIADGRVAEEWYVGDTYEFMRQLTDDDRS